jgi:threonine synthase
MTIRKVYEKYGLIIDTHTADGLKVGLENQTPDMPLIALETALPAKFAETIIEALGRPPERPPAMEGIERLPQRVAVLDADVSAVKRFIERNAGG